MSPEEEDAMEPSAADLAAIEREDEEEVEGLEEAFEISEDLLRRRKGGEKNEKNKEKMGGI